MPALAPARRLQSRVERSGSEVIDAALGVDPGVQLVLDDRDEVACGRKVEGSGINTP